MVKYTSAQKRFNVKKILADNWQLYALLLPGFLYILIFNYFPMYGIQIAFKNFNTGIGISGSKWVGLNFIQRFIEYPYFKTIVWNTMALSLYSIATFPCSIILALLLNELEDGLFKRTVQMVSYAPHFISTVVLCSMLTLYFARGTGLVNNIAEAMGRERVAYMTDPKYFRHMYEWSGVWQGIGWGTIIYLAALAAVPMEIHEAALIDGANRLHIIWHINIPTIVPTIMTMLILRCGNVLSVGFEKVFLMQNSLNLEVSEVISTYVYNVGIGGGQFSYSSAIGLFNNIVNILILILVNSIVKKLSDISIF